MFISAVLLIAIAPACGSKRGNDAGEVRHVVEDYLTAQASGNGAAACKLLAPHARRALEALSTVGSGGKPHSCMAVIERLPQLIGAERLVKSLGHGSVRMATVRRRMSMSCFFDRLSRRA